MQEQGAGPVTRRRYCPGPQRDDHLRSLPCCGSWPWPPPRTLSRRRAAASRRASSSDLTVLSVGGWFAVNGSRRRLEVGRDVIVIRPGSKGKPFTLTRGEGDTLRILPQFKMLGAVRPPRLVFLGRGGFIGLRGFPLARSERACEAQGGVSTETRPWRSRTCRAGCTRRRPVAGGAAHRARSRPFPGLRRPTARQNTEPGGRGSSSDVGARRSPRTARLQRQGGLPPRVRARARLRRGREASERRETPRMAEAAP